MNFCKKIDNKYVCTAKKQKYCEHALMETWEVFCQWCIGEDECGIGKAIHEVRNGTTVK